MMKRLGSLILSTAILASCAAPEDGATDDDLQWQTHAAALCNGLTPCDATPDFANSTVPLVMDPGEKFNPVVTMVNTGLGIWDTSFYRLYSQHIPRTFWGTPYENVTPPVLPLQSSAFNLVIVAPETPGTYPFDYRMREGAANLRFGTPYRVNISVSERQRFYDCANAGPLPQLLTASETIPVTFTVQNTGTVPWSSSGLFRLCERDNHLFGAQSCANLTSANTIPPGEASVPTGASANFTFNVTAPAIPGTYSLLREMRDASANGVQFFDDDVGDSCVQASVVVTLCGNQVLNVDEECDDGNLISGDGCDSECLIDAGNPVGTVIDLAVTNSDRQLNGQLVNRALGNVVIADVGGTSARPDVIVGETADASMPNRGNAGRVTAYDGNTFFSGGMSTVPTGAMWSISGEDAVDHLGGSSAGRIAVGDVTGDGVNDIIISAPNADGPNNTRTDCGEVYVIVGGAANLTGAIDLRTPPAGVVGYRIYGAEENARIRVLAVGNVGGTNALDLIIGSPGSDTVNGVDSGEVDVLYGGATLAGGGTFDLSTTAPNARVLGPQAGEFFGNVAAVGNLIGSGTPDLAVAHASHSLGGRTSMGAVWVLQGPLSGTRNLVSQFDVRIIGEQTNDDLGTSLAVGNVSGDATADLVIGIRQLNEPINSDQVGGVDVWEGPLIGGSYDLSLGDQPTSRIWGISQGDNTGSTLGLADVGGDPHLDILIGASGGDGPDEMRSNAGEISVVLGANDIGEVFLSSAGDDFLKVYGAAANNSMGAHPLNIAGGDASGDQDADVCIGSYRGGPNAGGRIDCFISP